MIDMIVHLDVVGVANVGYGCISHLRGYEGDGCDFSTHKGVSRGDDGWGERGGDRY